ncbi:DUF760 domain-containing protein [Leptolyngbya sp. FACHB-261]|nr:DUF760 domain-containing protein [Leptolyngbya sp. FACHB-261]MBD2100304.1 DUF760 domain-containing protein [Leptolyngbya sp. FACHB-261]
MNFNSNAAGLPGGDATQESTNPLLQYMQQQSPEVLASVGNSASPEVREAVLRNVRGLLGMLPPEGFQVEITTDREHLASLLASAMFTGYFLRSMEQRMALDHQLALIDSESTEA